MEELLSALFFVSAMGWVLFLVTVLLGMAPKLMRDTLREYAGNRSLLKLVMHGSYVGSILSTSAVILMNLMVCALVWSAAGEVGLNDPWALPFFLVGVVQAICIWGPTFQAIILWLVKERNWGNHDRDN